MRKGRDGGKTGKKKKRRMKIVATTSLQAVDRPNADRWNAARSRQLPNRFFNNPIYTGETLMSLAQFITFYFLTKVHLKQNEFYKI